MVRLEKGRRSVWGFGLILEEIARTVANHYLYADIKCIFA